MKKQLITLASLLVLSDMAFAQETVTVTNLAPSNTLTTTTQTQTVKQTVAANSQPEMIKQPTTVVEAAPLTTSRADELRKQREKSEVDTEQKIVERLEESRMEAEKKRQEAILGSFATKTEEKKQEAPVAPIVAAPMAMPPVAPQQPIVVELKQPEASKASSIEDVRSAVREELAASQNEVVEPKKTSQSYVRGTLGMINYDSSDVRTVGAIQGSFGKIFDDQWALEVSLLGANAYVDQSNFLYRKISQFDVGVGARYYILGSRVRPSVGFVLDYINRNYSELRDSLQFYQYANTNLRSWAVDYGLSAGLDFAVSDNLSVGAEYRFMTNLTYEYNDSVLNSPAYRANFGTVKPIEERDSNFLGFSVRYLF